MYNSKNHSKYSLNDKSHSCANLKTYHFSGSEKYKCNSENKSAHRLSNFIGNIIISIYFTWIIAWELVLTALKNSNPLTVGFMWIGIPILWGIIAFIVISICRLPFTLVAKE